MPTSALGGVEREPCAFHLAVGCGQEQIFYTVECQLCPSSGGLILFGENDDSLGCCRVCLWRRGEVCAGPSELLWILPW